MGNDRRHSGYLLLPLENGQVLAGSMPTWVALLAGWGIVYVWYMRLAPVMIVVLQPDGAVVFIRGVGRRRVQLFDRKAV